MPLGILCKASKELPSSGLLVISLTGAANESALEAAPMRQRGMTLAELLALQSDSLMSACSQSLFLTAVIFAGPIVQHLIEVSDGYNTSNATRSSIGVTTFLADALGFGGAVHASWDNLKRREWSRMPQPIERMEHK